MSAKKTRSELTRPYEGSGLLYGCEVLTIDKGIDGGVNNAINLVPQKKKC